MIKVKMVFIYLFLLVEGFTPIRIVKVIRKIVLEIYLEANLFVKAFLDTTFFKNKIMHKWYLLTEFLIWKIILIIEQRYLKKKR